MPAHAPIEPRSGRTPVFDAALISRYDVPGPRYDSYPSALQFSDAFDADAFRSAALASNEDPIPRDLSVYVHVPSCLSPDCHCGCNRDVPRDRRRGERYFDHLLREIGKVATLFDRDRHLVQLHIGGGSPNLLDGSLLRQLLDQLRRCFDLSCSPQREFAIEVCPRATTPDDIAMLSTLGFNRLSLGIADFCAEMRTAINRVQGIAETRDLLDAAEQHGFRSTSVDLIYGLPLQTPTSFAHTLDLVVAMRPRLVAIHECAHLPARFCAQRQIVRHALPDAVIRIELLGLAVEQLCAGSYLHIGMNQFALPDDDLAVAQRNGTLHHDFQGYSTHAQTDLIGLGASSIGHVGNSCSQNQAELCEYEAALDIDQLPIWRGLALSDDDLIRADVIQQLMCRG
ncbi:MAG: oxygen-independent coproporphyrinogen III oxidase, partial [Dokdonella sp.]